jgi:predicted O-methyltransferase YrrM
MSAVPDLDLIRAEFKRDQVYRDVVSPRALAVLDEIIDHPTFPGVTEPPVLSVLAMLVRLTRPGRVLQLGTHVGFSAIVVADLLQAHGGRLTTVDPVPVAHEHARHWVAKAGLAETVRFVDGASTDPAAHDDIGREGPYELAYLDSSHAYASTLQELDLLFEHPGWLAAHGLLVLHDVGREAARFDPTESGGVGRALREWTAARARAYQAVVLEPPLFPAPCGVGLLSRSPA